MVRQSHRGTWSRVSLVGCFPALPVMSSLGPPLQGPNSNVTHCQPALLPLGSPPWWQLRGFSRHKAPRTHSMHTGLCMLPGMAALLWSRCVSTVKINKSNIWNSILFLCTSSLLECCCMPHCRSCISVKRGEKQRGLEHCKPWAKPCFDLHWGEEKDIIRDV